VAYEIGDELPRPHYLLYALAAHRPHSAIVFVNTRTDASLIATVMAREGYRAEMLSGALAQRERERVMGGIRNGELRFLVATDIAARGIDISHLSHVINYALPEDPAVYLHRVGRTGRVGRKGVAVSLLSGRDIRTIQEIARRYKVSFDRRSFPPAEEMVKERIMAHIETLVQAADAAICDGFLAEAKAILGHPKADAVIAYLLKRNAERVHDEQRSVDNRPVDTGPRQGGRGGRGGYGGRGGRGGPRRRR
jgi:ATP-dependent RNA helicase DeaD